MITGVINANREATIHVVAIGPSGQQQEIEAIIDAGADSSRSQASLLAYLPIRLRAWLLLAALFREDTRIGIIS